MDAILSYIKPELLVLVPVLYFLGAGLKKAEAFPDNRIPLVLGIAGILLAALYVALPLLETVLRMVTGLL